MSQQESMELKYLKSLARQYPNIAAASTEIINLQAILNLPKGTEHFMLFQIFMENMSSSPMY